MLQKLLGFCLQESRIICSAPSASSEHTGNDCPVRKEYPFFCRAFRPESLHSNVIEDPFPVWIVPCAFRFEVIHLLLDFNIVDDPSDP